MLERLKKSRIAEQVVRQLQELIFNETFQPGDKLPSERSLSERLGVNRTSLREAIKKLEHLGLVSSRQGDGTRVLDYMNTAGVDLLQHLIPFALRDAKPGQARSELARDFLEVRQILGREIARLAAQRADAEDLDALREVTARARALASRGEDLLEVDFEFYAVLGRATKNRLISLLTNPLREVVARSARFFVPLNAPADATLAHHADLIDALGDHDPERAAQTASDYLQRWLDALETD